MYILFLSMYKLFPQEWNNLSTYDDHDCFVVLLRKGFGYFGLQTSLSNICMNWRWGNFDGIVKSISDSIRFFSNEIQIGT